MALPSPKGKAPNCFFLLNPPSLLLVSLQTFMIRNHFMKAKLKMQIVIWSSLLSAVSITMKKRADLKLQLWGRILWYETVARTLRRNANLSILASEREES